MRLIDADRLDAEIEKAETQLEEEMSTLGAGSIKAMIDDAPTVWPMFIGRGTGKHICNEWLAIHQLLDDFGLDANDPVDTIKFVLNAYNKVILECTGCQMSKLSYTPEAVIACICDTQTEDQDDLEVALANAEEKLFAAEELLRACEQEFKHLLDCAVENTSTRSYVRDLIDRLDVFLKPADTESEKDDESKE